MVLQKAGELEVGNLRRGAGAEFEPQSICPGLESGTDIAEEGAKAIRRHRWGHFIGLTVTTRQQVVEVHDGLRLRVFPFSRVSRFVVGGHNMNTSWSSNPHEHQSSPLIMAATLPPLKKKSS